MANDAVRRIMAEVKEFAGLNNAPTSFFHAAPLESDLFEWHFTVRGPPDTAFEQGVYHGRILLPPEYPLKPPEIILLTPNGRFEVGKRICLSVTAHHQETWQPSWGIRTILTALVGFMPSKAEGVGALDYPEEDRRGLARKSHLFRCTRCGVTPVEQLPPRALASPAGASETPSGQSGETVPMDQGGSSESASDPPTANGGASAVTNVSQSQPLGAADGDGAGAVSAEMAAGDGVEQVEQAPNTSAETVRSENRALEGPTTDAAMPTGQEGSGGVDAVDRATPGSAVQAQGVSGSEGERQEDGGQEKELLYIAYAIVALMLAVVARRVIKMFTE